jgi:CheY-like chemotaxis protein
MGAAAVCRRARRFDQRGSPVQARPIGRCETVTSGALVAPSTVFVVEDDVDTRDMLGRFLELEGFQVEVAANGKQALDRLTSGVHPCVILLDLMMPVMDGWQFRRQQVLDAELADIPVIVVSAAGKERIAGIDANGYLSKPVDLEQLLAQVNQYCCD